MAEVIIKSASWDADKAALMSVREEVFVKGQNVPASLESDDFEPVSFYVLAESTEGTPIACARLQPNGKVTRIAVLNSWSCLLYTSPSPRDATLARMPSSA